MENMRILRSRSASVTYLRQLFQQPSLALVEWTTTGEPLSAQKLENRAKAEDSRKDHLDIATATSRREFRVEFAPKNSFLSISQFREMRWVARSRPSIESSLAGWPKTAIGRPK
jgi:hypothetical protein